MKFLLGLTVGFTVGGVFGVWGVDILQERHRKLREAVIHAQATLTMIGGTLVDEVAARLCKDLIEDGEETE